MKIKKKIGVPILLTYGHNLLTRSGPWKKTHDNNYKRKRNCSKLANVRNIVYCQLY